MNIRWIAVGLISAAAAATSVILLPAPIDVAPASGFDTESGMRHLRFIASAPRPVGSPHHAAVRDYLVHQFGLFGCDVQVQDTQVRQSRFLRGLPVQVRNVIARRRGMSGSAKAIMLAAHYDSTRQHRAASHGAGDDGAAVAALLETARVLSSETIPNDIIFLITDAEELGLHGAQAFVQQHPWADDVGVVLNFEARGTSGPSIMFETSPANAALVSHYARVAPHPVASSLSAAIYERMPNDTDFTIFREHGMRGLNFAFIGDLANYHTAGDVIENLDVRSMRHHGVQALALARQFGRLDLSTLSAGEDAIFFSVLSRWVVRYPARYALRLAIVATLLCIAALASKRGGGIFRYAVEGAGLVIWAILALLSAIYLPGGSYLFAWPALFLAVALLLSRTFQHSAECWNVPGWIAVGGAGVVIVILWAPVAVLMVQALRTPGLGAAAIVGALAVWGFVPIYSAVSGGGGARSSTSPSSLDPSKSIRK